MMDKARQEALNRSLCRTIEVHEDFDDYLKAVEQGGDVNALSELYERPLIFSAVYAEQTEIVRDMIARGAEVNAATEDGWTPLHEAAHSGNVEIVQLLLDSGASLSALAAGGSGFGGYPIHAASGATILLLAEHGADLDARDELGRTPLHCNVVGRGVDEVRLFLKSGADPYPLDNEGKSPLDLLDPRGATDEELLDALAPVVAARDRRVLDAATTLPVKEETPAGECERCGRPAHTGRCRL